MTRSALAVLLVLLPATTGFSQQGASDGEWRYWGGDAGSTRYSPLDQITRDNVATLRVAWPG